MNINILAGGPEQYLPKQEELDFTNEWWVGVDRGVHTLLKFGIVPMAAFGDFDSVSESELIEIQKKLQKLHIFPSEKNETDLEIAFNWALTQKPRTINIYGATGGRIDHLMGNIQLLAANDFLEREERPEVYIIDNKNKLTVLPPGSYDVKQEPGMKYISFVPVTEEVKGLTLTGFKYPLENSHIKRGSTLCISNELISDYGNFSYSDGILMVISSSD
ncbi:thiamine diphosphokinase [Peribacillus sp. SCS-155]|uniref:thiamine diphosphokinase n=1 Tax=Peribacillus sedimenti TaxID=3115297 RepID=UPI0039067D01